MMNGCGCSMKCRADNGERYPLTDNGKGGLKCTCPICVCSCQAMYKVDAINEIKIGLLSQQTIGDHRLACHSKYKSSLSISESNDVIAKKLRKSLDAAEKMGSESQLRSDSNLSDAQETAYEFTATELSKDLHRHGPYIAEFRRDVTPQMTHGKATWIQKGGNVVDVRVLQRSKNLHQYNNNLNPAVIHQLDQVGGKSERDAISLVDDCGADEISEFENDTIGKEYTDPSTTRRLVYGTIEVEDDVPTYTKSEELYNAVTMFCFTQARTLIERKDYYMGMFKYLIDNDGRIMCTSVCDHAIKLHGHLSAEAAFEILEEFLSVHG